MADEFLQFARLQAPRPRFHIDIVGPYRRFKGVFGVFDVQAFEGASKWKWLGRWGLLGHVQVVSKRDSPPQPSGWFGL